MWSVWSVLFDSMGSVVLAIFLSLIGVCLYMALIGVLVGLRNMGFRVALGIPLWVLVAIQSILIAGAITVKGYVADTKDSIDSVISVVQSQSPDVNTGSLIDNVCQNVPMVKKLIDTESLRNVNANDLSNAIVDKMNGKVHDYIMRRIYWIIGFCVGTFILVLIIPGDTSSTTNRSGRGSRSDLRRSGTQNLRRASRARR